MIRRIEQLSRPPLFEDEEKTIMFRWLNGILLLLLATTIVLSLACLLAELLPGVLLNVASALVFLGLLLLARRGHARVASILLVLLLLLGTTLAAALWGGVQAGVIFAYFVHLALSALLLGRDEVLILGGLCILCVCGLFWAERAGIISGDELSGPLVRTIIISLLLAVTALILRLTFIRLNQALERARQNEQALASGNRELETEIVERRQAEEALRLNEMRLNSLLKLSQTAHELDEPDIVQLAIEEAVRLTSSGIGYLHFVNPDQQTIELVTWSEKTTEQCTAVYDSHYPLDMAGVWADCVRLGRPVVHNDYQGLTNKKGYPDGHAHVVRHASVPILDDGKIALILGVGNKVAEYDETDVRQMLLIGNQLVRILRRKRAEQALRDSEERYKAIFETAPDVVFIFEAEGENEGRIVAANQRAVEQHGYTLEELLSMTVSDLDAPADAFVPPTVLPRVLSGETISVEMMHRRQDGSVFPSEVRGRMFELDGHKLVAAFERDISNRKQAEEALRRYADDLEARNEELDAFSHTVAHDLRNPLHLMIGLIEILVSDCDLLSGEELRESLNAAAQAGRKMNDIIEELLLLARVHKLDVEAIPLDMAAIVQGALARVERMIAESRADVSLPEDWPLAVGHGPWIEEVWANYLSNAIKYGGKPPSVELGGEVLPDGMVRFWVRDDGPGILPGEQERLFSSFTRLDQERAAGHGLGLSIVKRIVDKLGGQVGVQSETGAGSTFYFTLPAPEPKISQPAPPTGHEARGS